MINKDRFKKITSGVVALGSIVGAAAANAAYTMPTAATAVFANMDSAYSQIEALIWPVLGAVTIGFFVIRMFKKGASKVG